MLTSGVVVAAVAFAARAEVRWPGSLNEWGDFVSGLASTIALVWLVLGYFQQQAELRLNTAALHLQHEELRRQVEETAALVEAQREHARTARLELEMTQAQMGRQEKRTARAAQPTFLFGGGNWSADRGELRLRNEGAPAHDVEIANKVEGVGVGALAYWPSGTQLGVAIARGADFPLAFRLRYRDQFGEPRWVEIACAAYQTPLRVARTSLDD